MAKGLKLKVRQFLGLISKFVEVSGEKLVEGGGSGGVGGGGAGLFASPHPEYG